MKIKIKTDIWNDLNKLRNITSLLIYSNFFILGIIGIILMFRKNDFWVGVCIIIVDVLIYLFPLLSVNKLEKIEKNGNKIKSK